MTEKLRKFADWERDWGALTRWVASGIFLCVVWCILSFGNAHYVTRAEFSQMNGKLDSLVRTVSEDAVRLEDVQNRLHRIENLQDSGREQGTASADPWDFAGK
jgi:hypothetical protein